MSSDFPLSPGQLLSQERERQHKTHSDVARQLRLTLRQVRALEDDSYALLPGTTFVRGFMRNYAKLLGLDPEALLRIYEANLPTPPVFEEPPPEPKEYPNLKIVGGAAAGVVAVAILGLAVSGIAPDFYNLNFSARILAPRSNLPIEDKRSSDTDRVPSKNSRQATGKPTRSPAAPSNQQVVRNESARTEPLVSAETAPKKELSEFASTSDSQEMLARLKFFFNEDAWVEVRDQDHQKVFSHLNIRGTEKVVDAAPPLTLVVGNARSVRVTYNDNEVDLTPHIKNNIARFNLD